MYRRIALASLIVVLLISLLLSSGIAAAQGPTLQDSDPAWQAYYWSNMALSGEHAVQTSETSLDHNWGAGRPHPEIPADQFSARWTRYLDLVGTYRFTATSDDGMRVYLDDTLIINEWYDHSTKTVSVERVLGAGHHWVVVEYYEKTGDAVARFSWTPVTGITNWRGEYFNNKTLTGPAALVRDDAQINFSWGSGSPKAGTVNSDSFSARWTRNLDLAAGTYRFSMTVDDGGRLWVSGHLLIGTWKDQAARTYTGDIYLPGGTVPVKMEYYENTGAATAKLSWTKLGGTGSSIIIDNGDAGFVKGGSASSWRRVGEGYAGDLLWTKNNDYVRPNYNWARWYPGLKAGRYEVYVYIPHRYTTTAKARYWISHRDGLTLRIVNQSAYSNQWVSLGTYRFQGNNSDYVSLADVTYEPYLSRLIAFDAVKWVPR